MNLMSAVVANVVKAGYSSPGKNRMAVIVGG